MNSQNSKAGLRNQIRAVLKNVPPEKQKSDSEKICAKLKLESFFQSAASVLFFAPLPGEVDLWPLLEESLVAGRIVALPRFDPAGQGYAVRRVQNPVREIVTGQFGIREPAAGCAEILLRDLDLVLVPGIAFDLSGRRLGRGRGFYDRLLSEFRGAKCGIAFDEQIAGEVPSEKLDIPMDFILTPSRCVKITG
jgi:5-formyltetrahydrofolate cyclo-ligase